VLALILRTLRIGHRVRLLLQLRLLLGHQCLVLRFRLDLSERLHLGQLVLFIGLGLSDVRFDLLLSLDLLLTVLRG
jgi:hypothetical protein